MNSAEDFSEKMKGIATQVIVFGAFALLGGTLTAMNSTPPMGEMGDFMYVFSRVAVCFGLWGLATGIGLWRRWRWARISMIVFGFILVACGALLPVALLLPVGGAAELDVEVHPPQGHVAGSSPSVACRGSPLVEILHAKQHEGVLP